MTVTISPLIFKEAFNYSIILFKCWDGGDRVLIDIRMKTGFFETKKYELLISSDRLVLSSKETENDSIIILVNNIISITLKNKKSPELEIQTREEIFQGNLTEKTDFEKLINSLKESLSVKIVCEYEGGK